MKNNRLLFIVFGMLTILTGACDAIQAIAPPPIPTLVPTATVPITTATPIPTLGALEYIDAAYCRESHVDDNEYYLIRFYPSGTVLDLVVQGYGSCQEAWAKTVPYLAETKTDIFNHGEYQLSGSQIQFTLMMAKSNKVAGIVVGTYEGETMHLKRQGADEAEYLRVYGGK